MKIIKDESVHESIEQFMKSVEYILAGSKNVCYYFIQFDSEEEFKKYTSPTIHSTSPYPVRGTPSQVVGRYMIVAEFTGCYNFHHRYEEDYIYLYDPQEMMNEYEEKKEIQITCIEGVIEDARDNLNELARVLDDKESTPIGS